MWKTRNNAWKTSFINGYLKNFKATFVLYFITLIYLGTRTTSVHDGRILKWKECVLKRRKEYFKSLFQGLMCKCRFQTKLKAYARSRTRHLQEDSLRVMLLCHKYANFTVRTTPQQSGVPRGPRVAPALHCIKQRTRIYWAVAKERPDLEVLPAHDGELLVVVGRARVRDAHHAAAPRRHAACPRLAQGVCNTTVPSRAVLLTLAWTRAAPDGYLLLYIPYHINTDQIDIKRS